MRSRAPSCRWLGAGLLGISLACSSEPEPSDPPQAPPPPPRAAASLPDPEVQTIALDYAAEPFARVARIDLDADGRDEIAVAGTNGVAVLGRLRGGTRFRVAWHEAGRGGATAIASGDLNGDGLDDLAVGWGEHRDRPDAEAALVTYLSGGPRRTLQSELVAQPETSRAQFTSLAVTPLEPGGGAGLLYAVHLSKYRVRGAFAWRTPERWHERELDRIRMGTHWAAAIWTGRSVDVHVGRPYGDELRAPGDVFQRQAGGARIPIPSVRGVRSLAVVEVGDRDAPLQLLCYGDGWHWRSREQAEGLLTCARPEAGGRWRALQVDATPDREIRDIAAGDIDGDGVTELLALSARATYAYTPTSSGPEPSWTRRVLGRGGRQFALVDTDGDGRAEVVLAGPKPALLALP